MCTGTYQVTQDDVDSGQAADAPPNGTIAVGTPWVQDDVATGCTLNTVPVLSVCGATAQNPSGGIVSTTDTQTLYVYGTGASASVSLSETSTSTFTASGQVLNYNYVVTNTGIDLVDRVECDRRR